MEICKNTRMQKYANTGACKKEMMDRKHIQRWQIIATNFSRPTFLLFKLGFQWSQCENGVFWFYKSASVQKLKQTEHSYLWYFQMNYIPKPNQILLFCKIIVKMAES